MSVTFSAPDGYKFVSNQVTTAVIDPDGRFTLREGNASVETFENWSDFVKKMGETPVTTNETDALAQLSRMGLGEVQLIRRNGGSDGIPANATPEEKDKVVAAGQVKLERAKTAVAAKNAANKKAAAKKTADKKAPKEKVLVDCHCGCGGQTSGKMGFCQGHDAKVHGWAKRVADGRMKLSELSSITKKWMSDHGIKQGKAAE